MLNPCKLDHNGECLICDCTIDNCAWNRYINEDFRYENKEELEKMFSINNVSPHMLGDMDNKTTEDENESK